MIVEVLKTSNLPVYLRLKLYELMENMLAQNNRA